MYYSKKSETAIYFTVSIKFIQLSILVQEVSYLLLLYCFDLLINAFNTIEKFIRVNRLGLTVYIYMNSSNFFLSELVTHIVPDCVNFHS